jgi:predicted alpha/beta superfamily hydrolase
MNMPTSALPRFGIFKTEARVFRSECVGQEYEIGVWLPFSYASTDRAYPVLYVPDGEFVYPAVMGLMPTHMGSGAVPEMIVVGIGYHGISTWEEFGDLRYRDFLPQGDLQPEKISRLAQYTRFYQQELFPLVEREYRASAEDRAIFGFSCGGMFALQMMLTQPGMFRRHVAASCTWSQAYLLECVQQYALQPARPPVDLFLSVGGLEEGMLPGYQAVVEKLQNGQTPEVRLRTQIYAGENHSAGVIAKTFLDGTREVFKA